VSLNISISLINVVYVCVYIIRIRTRFDENCKWISLPFLLTTKIQWHDSGLICIQERDPSTRTGPQVREKCHTWNPYIHTILEGLQRDNFIHVPHRNLHNSTITESNLTGFFAKCS